ncbi:MAG: hypothetical protein AMJ93_14080, partial [Anaerolineae bacterium SM23_84]
MRDKYHIANILALLLALALTLASAQPVRADPRWQNYWNPSSWPGTHTILYWPYQNYAQYRQTLLGPAWNTGL